MSVEQSDHLPLLIGLNGFKGVGKDTVGQILVDDHGFKRLAFADKLKEALAALFDVDPALWDMIKNDPNVKVVLFDEEVGDVYSEMTVRELLKRGGTEMGRNVLGKAVWVDMILPFKDFSTAGANLLYHGNRVVTDVRFQNELARIKELRGFNIRIERPGYEGDEHESEQLPPAWLIDYIIVNDGRMDELHGKVNEALEDLFKLQAVS